MNFKVILQRAVLVIALALGLTVLLENTNISSYLNIDIKAVDLKIVFIICLLVSSVILFVINRVLSLMSEILYLSSPLSKIDKMTGEEFERYLSARLKRLGYKVEMTPASGDYGADLFCFTKNETMVIQAKRYEANVGTAAVQQIVGAKEYYEADSCAVITNSYFTVNAYNLAEANEVVLIDRDDLLHFDFARLHRSV